MRSINYKTIDFEVRNGSISFFFCHYCRIQIATYTSRSEARVFGLYFRGWFPLYFSNAERTRSTNEIEAIEIEDRKDFGLIIPRATTKLCENFWSTYDVVSVIVPCNVAEAPSISSH